MAGRKKAVPFSDCAAACPAGIGVILEDIRSIQNLILDKIAVTDVRLDRIEARLDRMDRRFDGVDLRFNLMDARFDRMDSHMGAMETGLKELRVSVDGRFQAHDTRFSQLEGAA